METLFRFVLSRPAVDQDEEQPSIRLSQSSGYQAALGQAQETEIPRESIKTVSRQFVLSTFFIGTPKDLVIYDALKRFSTRLDVLENYPEVANTDILTAIEEAFGQAGTTLMEEKTLEGPLAALKDSILAIKYLPEEHSRPIEALANQLRDIEIIIKTASSSDFPLDGPFLRRYRRRSLMLPSVAELKSSLSTIEKQQEKERIRREKEEKLLQEAETKIGIYKKLKASISELTNISSEHFQNTVQQVSEGALVPPVYRPEQVFIQKMNQQQQLVQLEMMKAQAEVGKVYKKSKITEQTITNIDDDLRRQESLNYKEIPLQTGIPAFRPLELRNTSFRLKESVQNVLSKETQELLQIRGLRLSDRPLDQIIEILQHELRTINNELDSHFGRPTQQTFKRYGNTMVVISSPMPTVWNSMVIDNTLLKTDLQKYYLDDRIPRSHGSVTPAGVAELLVVKQQLLRYEGGEVAHIENILKGEKKEREHIRRRESEEFSFQENETTTSEERELESTNRFELSKETSETIKEDASLKAGLSISGSYGPTVQFSVSAEGSYSRTREESTKTASKFSQDVTQRSANKITKRVLERSSLRVTNEVIEKNNHSLNNEGGEGNISGVYQWVNKVYQAQMFNYGARTLYDFMVPEPGAFLIASLQNTHSHALEIEKPGPFTLRPDQITETNFYDWVKRYGATDVVAPPEIYKTKSLDFKAGGGDQNADYDHSAQISIDEGYKAIFATVGKVNNIWDNNAVVDVILGNRAHRFAEKDWMWSVSLDEERDTIPFAMKTWKVSRVGIGIEIKCQRTERAMDNWRLDTHAKLMQAYKARMAEYEEKLAALELQAGIAIKGKNPALNLEMMKDELKKNCISILTEQHFDLFDAIALGSNGLPQIDTYENEAEGPYVRFFEQAFEWEQMTWITYPYFWGRKSQWAERIAYEDVDPVFNQFLKAGYCRVNVPAREGFEGAIDHFMTFGEIWNGGPLPIISNPLYLPIADEIAERLGRPGKETPQGDPWLVRIPTTLVKLRPDDQLPVWEQDESGNWVEKP